MDIKVKRVRSDAIIPTKAHDRDAGWDFYWSPQRYPEWDERREYDDSLEESIKKSYRTDGFKSWLVLDTGISISIPKGYCMVLFGRSGLALNNGFDMMAGVIDSGYTGEIRVILSVPSDTRGLTCNSIYKINFGFKCAQGLILPVPEVNLVVTNDLEESERGEKGYGSSDGPKVIKGS